MYHQFKGKCKLTLNFVKVLDIRTTIFELSLIGLISMVSTAPYAQAANKCSDVFTEILDTPSNVHTETSISRTLRSKSLRDSGVTYLTHITSISSALQILQGKTFKSSDVMKKEQPDLEFANTGDPSFVYFSWTDQKLEDFKKVVGYERSVQITLLLPLSHIDKPSFHHYSQTWSYGSSVSKAYTASNFTSGLFEPGNVNTHVEVTFLDAVNFKPEEVRLIVAPKFRPMLLEKLRSLDPSVNWEKVVLERVDPFSDPTLMSFEDFARLHSLDALKDIYKMDKAKSLELSRQYFTWVGERKSELSFVSSDNFIRLIDWIYALNDFRGYVRDVQIAMRSPNAKWQFEAFLELAKNVRNNVNDSYYNNPPFSKDGCLELQSLIRQWYNSLPREGKMRFKDVIGLKYYEDY